MDEQEYAKIISANLKRLAYEHGKLQIDIARDLDINPATLSSWMNGTRIPKMSKIDILCAYFGVNRSDITEPYDENKERKYQLSRFEVQLIKAYRSAPDDMKNAVEKLLDVQKKGNAEPQQETFSA